jgi:hypothetical protein
MATSVVEIMTNPSVRAIYQYESPISLNQWFLFPAVLFLREHQFARSHPLVARPEAFGDKPAS